MPLPQPPTNYAAVVDPPTTCTLTWINGADAQDVIHEISYDGGATWNQLDHDTVPAVTSDHSLNQDATAKIRARSKNAQGFSSYTPVVTVVTGHYDA